MGKIKIVLIIVLLVAGIGIMLYPAYSKKKTADKQEVMMTDLKKKIEENKLNKKDSNESISDNTENRKKNTYDPDLVREEVKKLEIEENEKNVNNSNSDELLKNQQVIGIINIPTIDIEFPIVEGSNRANIAVAIGHMKGTSVLGGEGNCVLAGHHGGIYGVFFKNLEKLKKDDKVVLTDEYGKSYTYKVSKSFKVKPTDVYVTDNLEGYNLTLLTCQDNGKNRLIVRCKLEN